MIDNFTNKLFNAKWEEILPQIPDNSVDIVITSPPYNVSLGVGNKHKVDAYDGYDDDMPYNDYLAWMDRLWKECYRVLKVGGRVAINIGDGRNGAVPTHAEFIHRMRKVTETPDGKGFQMMANLVWEKSQISNRFSWGSWQSPSQPSFPKPFEYIIIMGKDTCNHEGAKEDITVTKKEFKDFSLGLWRFPPETRMMELYKHPAVFPEELPYRLIQMLTYKNDIVLEPFLGSGTTCAVAKKTGRRYIGVEMSKKYYDIASERVKNTGVTQRSTDSSAKPQESTGSLFD